jgi:hypothetical protein
MAFDGYFLSPTYRTANLLKCDGVLFPDFRKQMSNRSSRNLPANYPHALVSERISGVHLSMLTNTHLKYGPVLVKT